MKKMIGYGFAVLVGAGALAFEMSESLNFWRLAFPADKAFLAYLGFFLTSVAMLGYFYEFLYVAVGKTQKTVAIVMAIICGLGALLTAGMGFQITSYSAQGWEFTKADMESMAIIVQGLIAAHILALFVFYGGDAIAKAWKDDDGDGVPNIIDPDYKKNKGQKPQQNQPMHSNAADLALIENLQKKLDELEKANAAQKDLQKDPNSPAGKS